MIWTTVGIFAFLVLSAWIIWKILRARRASVVHKAGIPSSPREHSARSILRLERREYLLPFDMDKIDLMTQHAIAKMDGDNLEDAQSILRRAAHSYPCVNTLNNIGVFYKTFGIILHGNGHRYANKLGHNLLLKAHSHKEHYKNCMALGWSFFDMGDYGLAEKYYLQALTLHESVGTLYNSGTVLFCQQRYAEALPYFQRSSVCCVDDDYRGIIEKANVVCNYLVGDIHRAISLLGSIDDFESEFGMDAVAVAYLCGKPDYALDIYSQLRDKWSCPIGIFAMVFDSLCGMNKKEEAINQLDEYSSEQGRSNRDVKYIRKQIADNDRRKEFIAGYRFGLPMRHICYYVGCPEHMTDG